MPYVKSPSGLDGLWKGKLLDVGELPPGDRIGKHGLSNPTTIVEVIGDQKLVEEAVAYARSRGIIGADAETSGLDPYVNEIIIFQLGDQERQYLIWWKTIDPTPIYDLMYDSSVVKVGANIKFDLKFLLAEKGKDKKGQYRGRAQNVADIQLIEQIISCGVLGFSVGHTMEMTGMDNLAADWLGFKIQKDLELRTGWERMEPGNWVYYKDGEPIPGGQSKKFYAADDVTLPLAIIQRQKPWIRQLGFVNTVNLEHAFLPVLAEMEIRGLVVDWDKWDRLAEEAERGFHEAEKELDKLFDTNLTVWTDLEGKQEIEREVNYGSTEQLADLIHEYMKKEHKTTVIINNKQFYNALKATGKIPEIRLDKMFEKSMVPNPKNPQKRMQVGYPAMSDLVEKYWDDYHYYLPPDSFRVWDTESKTLKLYKIIWEAEHVDPELPTQIGLPPKLIDPILKYRDNITKLERYAWTWHDMVNPVTGRVHTSFTQCATNTGRLSSSPNFQNIPAKTVTLPDGTKLDYRQPFIAPPGHKIVGADWSQIEPRVTAELSMSPVYMRVFWSEFPESDGYKFWCRDNPKEKLDLYASVGAKVGILPPEFQTKDACSATAEGKKGRKQSKIIVLGLTYGTGVDKFWLTLIVDTEEHHFRDYAVKLHRDFWSAVQEVEDVMNKASALAGPKSYRKVWHYRPRVSGNKYPGAEVAWSETIGGRKRFFHPNNGGWWTEGRNHPIQGTAGGDIFKAAAVVLQRWFWEEEIPGGLTLGVHDEFLAEVEDRDGYPEIVKNRMVEVMSEIGQKYCPHVPITADAYIKDFWFKD